MSEKPKICYSVDEAAKAVGIGRTQFYKEIKEGRIEVLKAGKRTLVTDEALQSWLVVLRENRKSIKSRKAPANV